MNKKGFTMVELLGILVVLGIILLLSVPPIMENLRLNQKNEYDNYVQMIYTASEAYVIENSHQFDWTKMDNRIELRNLIDNNYINGNIINPNTKKTIMEEESIIELSKNSNNLLVFNYVYKEK